ncbi:MAG: cytochrome P450 [Alphaproteobacteria bacterium]|jgi:cytochrome P450
MIQAISLKAQIWGRGFAAVFSLLRQGLPRWRGGTIAAWLAETPTQRLVFAVLRAFRPNLLLNRKLISAYENTATAIVTRQQDVTEVLEREADFEVVYEPKMRLITGGENFFLGMQDSATYTRDVSLARLVIKREDVTARLIPFVAAECESIVAASAGRLDLAQELTRRVPARLVAHYFGTPKQDEDKLIAWTTLMFWYLFVDLKGEKAITDQALAAAAECRAWLDAWIAARKANPTTQDDILNRCLALQGTGIGGMDDLAIRNLLIGIFIGLVPTLSKSAILAMTELLERPEALTEARAAARADQDQRLAELVFEAFRFAPMNPVIYRRATRDLEIARGTNRRLQIPVGTMVLASNLSAMFDPMAVAAPEDFAPGRPWHVYMLWGYGMHTCFGQHINRAIIPQMLKPVLKRDGLTAEAAPDGAGTPFPARFPIHFAKG